MIHDRVIEIVDFRGGIVQPARELGAKQPSVHRAARELESLAGVPFFEPDRGGIALTPSAEGFVHQARLAMVEPRQGSFEIDAYSGQDRTVIVIGSMPFSPRSILPEAINQLLSSGATGVQIECIDAPYPSLSRDLRFGEIDALIGVLRDPHPEPNVTQARFLDLICAFCREKYHHPGTW